MFITIVIEAIPYLVFILWSGDNKSLAGLARAVTANAAADELEPRIAKRRAGIFKWLRDHYPDSLLPLDKVSNNILSFRKLLDYAAGSPEHVSVTLPCNMFGEFMPGIVALVSGGSIKINTPRGTNSASLRPTLSIFGHNISTDAPGPHGPFGEVHFRFAHAHWPTRIRLLIEEYTSKASDDYCAGLIRHARSASSASTGEEKKTPHRSKVATADAPKVASLSTPSSVSSSKLASFCIWIRMATTNPKKNMTQQLLGIIIEEIARVAMLAGDGITGCELILLGDRVPIGKYTGGADIGAELQHHLKKTSLTHTVLDLRGYFDTHSPSFEKFHQTFLPVSAGTLPGSGTYLSYYLQWTVLNWLANHHNPVFVVGSESGNMDAMGHMGVQVISIDLTDKVSETEHYFLTDRIGQYALMTPLWQIVNYEKGANEAGFRGYLRGAMLRYLLAAKPELLTFIAPKADGGSAPAVSIPVPVTRAPVEPAKKILLIEEDTTGSVHDEINARTLTIVHACDDGNCLFDAIAQQIGSTASTLRARAATALGDPKNAAMRVDGAYIDTMQLNDIATALGVSIVLYEAHYEAAAAILLAPMGNGPTTVYVLLRTIEGEQHGHYDLLRMVG